MVSLRSDKPICAPPRLSEVSPTLPLKRFQCSSDWRWPFLVLSQGRSSSASSFYASLLQAIDVWCPWLCARTLCLKLLNTSDLPRGKPFARVTLPASLSARSLPFTQWKWFCIMMGTDESHLNIFNNCEGQSQKTASTKPNCWREKRGWSEESTSLFSLKKKRIKK